MLSSGIVFEQDRLLKNYKEKVGSFKLGIFQL